MKQAKWIWYPGDFEIYHSLKQNCSREERGFCWPAFWKMDDCRKNVRFIRTFFVDKRTEFKIITNKQGFIELDGKKHPCGKILHVNPGNHIVKVYVCCTEGLPAIYSNAEALWTGEEWKVDDYTGSMMKPGMNSYYIREDQDPCVWEYQQEECFPADTIEYPEGVLYDFKRELTAVVVCEFIRDFHEITICYGESEKEARDIENCYYSQTLESEKDEIPRRAFRYLFIPGQKKEDLKIRAVHQYVDFPEKGKFSCEDEKMNRIWNVAAATFKLCSGIFFIDGVKRDRWIWSGDAYQSYYINQYLMADREIEERTILALRGNDPVKQHINTIVDYSMYWVISVYQHYMAFGNVDFLKQVYPKMKTMMSFLKEQTDELGFIIGKDDDWVFIDWSDIDKEGPVCAEQMLLAECWKVMEYCAEIIGEASADYKKYRKELQDNILKFFWDEIQGAFIDSYVSGRRHVTRHGNIFAVLFDIADQRKKEKILKNVIFNDDIPAITTPYFEFYELELLCKIGEYHDVKERILRYWGGMLDRGAVTFWEEFDPDQTEARQYEMYGDPYGKSFCHAWGASPIYLIGRYFMGVRPLTPGYETFEVKPVYSLWKSASCILPVNQGQVHIHWSHKKLKVTVDRNGGYLIWKEEKIPLIKNQTVDIILD